MENRRKRLSFFPFLAILLTLFLSACSLDGMQGTSSIPKNADELVVHYIDVGQGDSTLIELPNDESVLIDGGTRGSGQVVADYLDQEGIEHLDYLIATHPHEDHIGGLVQIVKDYSIGDIYMPKVNHSTQVYENLLQAIADKGYRISSPGVGEFMIDEDYLTMNVLAPAEEMTGSNLNNYSIANRLVYGDTSFLFTGDAEKKSEEYMVENGYDLRADVLKVGHHGGDTSTIESFLAKVKPTYGVISAGIDNQYGHPHANVLDRLANQGVDIFRTDEQGTIVARSDGKTIRFDQAASAEATVKTQTDEIIVHGSASGSKYHLESCRFVNEDQDFLMTIKEAKAEGLEACQVCNPPQ